MPNPEPRCPRCESENVDEPDQSGSAQRWFECASCGHRWTERPASGGSSSRQPGASRGNQR